MRSNSPTVESSKFNTLPDDLKSIADKMLREKFQEKEVVVESRGPFPEDELQAHFISNESSRIINETFYKYRIPREYEFNDKVEIEYQPWIHGRIAKFRIYRPRHSDIMDALRYFYNKNISSRKMTIVAGLEFWSFIRSDLAFEQSISINNNYNREFVEGAQARVGSFMGVDVVLDDINKHECYVKVELDGYNI